MGSGAIDALRTPFEETGVVETRCTNPPVLVNVPNNEDEHSRKSVLAQVPAWARGGAPTTP